VAVVLGLLTAIEIGALYVPGIPSHALVALLLVFSVFKFGLVVAFFMHLRYDNKLLTVLFVGPLIIAMAIILAIMALFGAYILLARG
jgi:cytochrome c oxidase subunit 4